MADDRIDDLIDRLGELINVYEKTEGTFVPSTLGEAVKGGWEMVVDALQLGVTVGYPESERKADKQRLVRVADVLQIIANMEQRYVANFVTDPTCVLLQFVYAIRDFIPNAINAIIATIEQVWSYRDWINLVWRLIRKFWDQAFAAMGIVELGRAVELSVRLRAGYVNQVRRKALPQRDVSRVRRRKKTRA